MTNNFLNRNRLFILQNKIDIKKFTISLTVIAGLLWVTFMSLGIFRLIIMPIMISTLIHWVFLPYAKGLFKKEIKT